MKIKGRRQSSNVEVKGKTAGKQARQLRSAKGPRINSDADVYGGTMITVGRKNIAKQSWVNKKKNRTQ